jgi:hypothetical protein
MTIKLGILKSFDRSYQNYVSACKEINVPFEVVDILSPDWVKILKDCDCDGYMARPPCDFPERKAIFDERLYFLNKVIKRPIYPSFDELLVYENKRAMAHWLQLHGFMHPKTKVFCRKPDAMQYVKSCSYPIVFKSSIGASSSQVRIVKNIREAKRIIHRLFGFFHPELARGYIGYRFRGISLPVFGRVQKHYAIIQPFSHIKWEWRVIKIGNSYFGHKKLLRGGLASGSNRVGWEAPPEDLLWLIKNVCDTGRFRSMALDVFETQEGTFLINELQSIFGSYNESQMYINGKPGRYRLIDDKFVFQPGYFNRHASQLLRVKHFLELLKAAPNKTVKLVSGSGG